MTDECPASCRAMPIPIRHWRPSCTMEHGARAGLTPDQVRQRVRSGRWIRLARGVYRTRLEDDGADEWAAARGLHADRADRGGIGARRLRDRVRQCGSRPRAAAVAVSWPERVPGRARRGSQRSTARSGRSPHGAARARRRLDHRVPITSVPRTWLDVARSGRLVDGLVLGDAALRAELMTATDVRRVLATSWARRGIRVAPSGRPTPRWKTRDPAGVRFVGLLHRPPASRCRACRWRSGRLTAASWRGSTSCGTSATCRRGGDGRMKYVDADALYAEKRREDEHPGEGCGYRMGRWGATDLRDDGSGRSPPPSPAPRRHKAHRD